MNPKLLVALFCVGLSFGAASAKKDQAPTNMDIILERLTSIEQNFEKRTEHLEEQMENIKGSLKDGIGGPMARQGVDDGEDAPTGIVEETFYYILKTFYEVQNITDHLYTVDTRTLHIEEVVDESYKGIVALMTEVDWLKQAVNAQKSTLDYLESDAKEIKTKLGKVKEVADLTYKKVVDVDRHVEYNTKDLEKVEKALEDAAALADKKDAAIEMVKMMVREIDGKADSTWKKLDAALKNQNKLYEAIGNSKKEIEQTVYDAEKDLKKEIAKLDEPVSELPVIQDRVYFISRGVEYLSKKIYSTSQSVNYIKNEIADLVNDPHARVDDGEDVDEDADFMEKK